MQNERDGIEMSVQKLLDEAAAGFPGRRGIWFRDMASGETASVHGTERFRSASLIKLPLALQLGELIAKGQYRLDEKRPISPHNRVQGTGVFQFLNHDYVPTVAELLFFAIAETDNIATNEMVDMVGGLPAAQAYIDRAGLSMTFGRKMMDLSAAARGEENYTTPEAVGTLFARLENDRRKDAMTAGEKELWYALKMQQVRGKMPSVLPCEEFYDLHHKDLPAPGKVIVGNKTGDSWSVQNDSGIFILPDGRSYVLVVCTDDTKDPQVGCEFIRTISKLVYDAMNGKKG